MHGKCDVRTQQKYYFKMAEITAESDVSTLSFDVNASMFITAREMKEDENGGKSDNANVSSNNSLESEDICDELHHSGEIFSKAANVQHLDNVCANNHNDVKDGPDDNFENNTSSTEDSSEPTQPQMPSDKADDTELSNNIEETQHLTTNAETDLSKHLVNQEDMPSDLMNMIPSYHEDTVDSLSANEDLYLPRSVLVNTSQGLSAMDYIGQATENSVYNGTQVLTGAPLYNEPIPCDQYEGASGYTNDCDYQIGNGIVTHGSTAGQLYYDSSGLAYSYDGYQFYAAQTNTGYPNLQTNPAQPTACILTQYGETTYVNYVPSSYLPQYMDSANGYSYNQEQSLVHQAEQQCVQPQPVQQAYNETTTQKASEQNTSDNNVNTSENVGADASQTDLKTEHEDGCERENGEMLMCESLENEEESTHRYKSWNDFRAPEIKDSVPVTQITADGQDTADGRNAEDGPTKSDDVSRDCPQSECPYPSLFVSENGLITVLLRNDISLEMTVNRDLRLVSHLKKLVVATNSRGNSSYMMHPAIKLSQSGTTTDLDVFLARKAKMTTDNITFGNNFGCYKFDYKKLDEEPSPVFKDLSKDESVGFLESDGSKSKDELISECCCKSSEAHFDYFSNGGFKLFINGVKVVQNSTGEVTVSNGPKFLRMSPSNSRLCVQTHFMEASVEANWNVKVKRGTHTLHASHLGFVVGNGQIEASFDDRNRLRVLKLPERIPLRLGQIRQRRPGVQRRRYPSRGYDADSEETFHRAMRHR